MREIVYLIKNIEEYGKLMAYCIEHDITVWRTYWNENNKGKICYHIDWKDRRCYYSNIDYYQGTNIYKKVYDIVEPVFEFDEYGNVTICKQPKSQGDADA